MTEFAAVADVAGVFEHFGARAIGTHSCYQWSLVFRAERDGAAVVLKRTADRIAEWCHRLDAQGIPVVVPVDVAEVDGKRWVVYPWIDGRRYDGSLADVTAAGDLLGRIHAVGGTELKPFTWPVYEPGEPAKDLPELREKFGEHAPEHLDAIMDRLVPLGERFERTTLPAIRDAGLPVVDATVDYKANNLVFTDEGPVLIDPDNGECLPRVLDLALAALMFHMEDIPGRPFTGEEWIAFRDAYLAHVELSEAEVAAWPDAVDYMLWEFGTWAMADSSEWHVPRQRSFLIGLAQVRADDLPV
ncbi:phosphotransferase [Allokutzneria albata]|uniref:Ser/Thr protein kinase RdoA involved in Cpx stress response, MazF antagonist n=1 Tax=Allokutzneria albata TaxID=211114 RepID=A0A1H0A1U7_ALLAB|nr:phosphotransferase [Allokutzneria albata]SDN27772.1 Ser/Thr protein kinase RdoA involved in Cpx stress response, MazF antagonist [Allokutzneria albata]